MISLVALSLYLASPPAAPAAQDLFVLRCSGLDGLFVDPRDAGLKALLELADERLAELPADFDGSYDLPPDALPFVARLLTSPLGLRIGRDPAAEDFPFFAELRCTGGSEPAAAELLARAVRLLTELGMEPTAPDSLGVRALPAPAPTTLAAKGAELVLAVGTPPLEPLGLRETRLPEGVEPALAVQADGGALLELLSMEPEAEPFVELMRALGLGQATFGWALGFDARSAIGVSTLGGCAQALQERGLVAKTGLTRASLRPIPADASWVSVSCVDLHGAWRWLYGMLGEQGADLGELDRALERLTVETGVALERDLLAPLGDQIGMYASDSTGGGGLMSTVLFAQVDDVDTLAASLRRLEARLNVLARDEAEGYVEVRQRVAGDVSLATLTFPGLPVPLEPSWALAGGYFVLGATPQAVEAALDQIAGGRPDLTASPGFARALPAGWEGALALSWVDSARYVREGYGLASLATSALSNAVRSREDEARSAGPALPTYASLALDPHAYVSTTRVVGDALVVETRFDRSWSVNIAALAGYASAMMGGSPMLIAGPGLLASLVLPRVVMARDRAEWTAQTLDVVMLSAACEEYYINNGGVWPSSLELLVTPDENGYTYLRERELPLDPWGRPFRYDPPTAQEPRPRIYTLGRDGAPGGEGEDRDLDNWMIEDGEDY